MYNTAEKLNKLVEVSNQLKTEFVGLDDIIDRIITSIKPWYITPEILDKPLIVSLWGITGTGKTSVIKRLLELLDVNKKIIFDSGELNKENGYQNFSDVIVEELSLDDIVSSKVELIENNTVFILDEFQHARTINERGEEVTRPLLRQLWSLIDNGQLTVKVSNSYARSQVINFVEDFEIIANNYPDQPLDKLSTDNKEFIEFILSNIGAYWFESRTVELLSSTAKSDEGLLTYEVEVEEEQEEPKDPLRPLNILPQGILRYLTTVTKNINDDMVNLVSLLNCKTVSELHAVLKRIEDYAKIQTTITFKQSLIFIIGNLDEAFYEVNNTSPDISANRFKQQVDKITIADLKRALQYRFRAEQVARFGNNIIKYPVFSEEEFKCIIKLNLDTTLRTFQKKFNKLIRYTEDVVDLIYSEGVYPTQGCRPIFTTITNIFTSLLSNILIDFDEETNIVVEIKDPELGYRVSTKTMVFTSLDSGKSKEYNLPLILGSIRDPKNNINRYLFGAHEAGHAIMTAYACGEAPEEIIGTAADGGGFIVNYITDEQITKEKIINRILIYLGGYISEKVMFCNPKDDPEGLKISTGAKQDIKEIWELIIKAAYEWGYFGPIKYSNTSSTSRTDGLITGVSSDEVDELVKKELDRLIKITENVLSQETKLISAIGVILAEKGFMTSEEFIKLVDRYGNKVTIAHMKQVKFKTSIDYYEKKLKEIGS